MENRERAVVHGAHVHGGGGDSSEALLASLFLQNVQRLIGHLSNGGRLPFQPMSLEFQGTV